MRHVLCILTILLLLPACGERQIERTRNGGTSSDELTEIEKLDRAASAELARVVRQKDDPAVMAEEMREELLNAATQGNLEEVRELLQKGADPNGKDEQGLTPLHWLAGHQLDLGGDFDTEEQVEFAEILISKGASLSSRDNRGMTPLHLYVKKGPYKLAEFALSNGADVNATDNEGRTPLDLALDAQNYGTLMLLREHGARPARRPPENIHEAVVLGDIEGVRKFLAAGTDVNSKNRAEFTPLHLAVFSGDLMIVKLLIARGADVNALGVECSTPLHEAILCGKKDIMELLIAKGANINARDLILGTPLHYAAEKRRVEFAAILVASGAEVNSTNSDDKTPLDLAKSKEMRQLLLRHGAVSGKELKESKEE
jgi:cytohesin